MSPKKIYIRLTESDDYEEPMVSLELFLKNSEKISNYVLENLGAYGKPRVIQIIFGKKKYSNMF